jgi:hypothetical protein
MEQLCYNNLLELNMSRFIIDGYNLQHQLGYVVKGQPHAHFERGRKEMIAWLRQQLGEKSWELHIVFDAQKSSKSRHRFEDYDAIHVEFALGDSADNRIAQIVQTLPQPRLWTVVSNDHLVRDHASRYQCGVLACQQWIDRLQMKSSFAANKQTLDEKPTKLTSDDAELLRIFQEPK